jgi:hypothetical protein
MHQARIELDLLQGTLDQPRIRGIIFHQEQYRIRAQTVVSFVPG